MIYKLNAEEREVLGLLKDDCTDLFKLLRINLIKIVCELNQAILNYLLKLKKIDITAIKKKGLLSILVDRAYQFFNLECQDSETSEHQKFKFKIAKKKLRKVLKRTLKYMVFPVYILYLVVENAFFTRKKVKKNVNKYINT